MEGSEEPLAEGLSGEDLAPEEGKWLVEAVDLADINRERAVLSRAG